MRARSASCFSRLCGSDLATPTENAGKRWKKILVTRAVIFASRKRAKEERGNDREHTGKGPDAERGAARAGHPQRRRVEEAEGVGELKHGARLEGPQRDEPLPHAGVHGGRLDVGRRANEKM
jgi:hypothetical protein